MEGVFAGIIVVEDDFYHVISFEDEAVGVGAVD